MEKENTPADVESGEFPNTISYKDLLLNQGVLTQEMVQWEYEGSGTQEDPYVVVWMDKDPRNPMTWSNPKKWIMCLSMAVATLTVSFCSSAYSGGTICAP